MFNIEPKEVFDWFYEINQIPRCSGNEKNMSDFLVEFARERNLEFIRDEVGNVIIKKPASEGYENSLPVMIQGHTDMVCVKNDDTVHDFLCDPIEMYVDGDFLRAKGTTLGGDDGIAVAYGLAILDGEYRHPDLEVIFTVSEETTMIGASSLKKEMLNGKRLINIDSDKEGYFLLSSAGGYTIRTEFDIRREKKTQDAVEISVSGLAGGHSGQDIILKRANAFKIMFSILDEIRKNNDLQIADVFGGSKSNVIPGFSKAVITVEDFEKAIASIEKISKEIKDKYADSDKNLKIAYKKVNVEEQFTRELTDSLIDYFSMIPDGVIAMSKDMDGLVETSLNTGVIKNEDGKIVAETLIRSSLDSSLDEVFETLKNAAKKTGAKIELTDRFPVWEYKKESEMRDIAAKTYREVFGEDAKFEAIHAGLECGFFENLIPEIDMISFGPDMLDIHSTNERISISSTNRMWKFLKKYLENLK